MSEHRLVWVDAFAERPFHGNPCAVVFDADEIDTATRLAVTRETRLSECAFLQRSDKAAFGARYYTAAGEIPMAGHPTVATLTALLSEERLPRPSPAEPVETTLEIGAGVLPITLRTADDGDRPAAVGPWVDMLQPAPRFGRTYAPAEIAALVGLEPADIVAPPRTVSTGTPFLVTLLRDHAALRRARLDVAALRRIQTDADFGEPFLAALGGATEAGDTFARLLLAPPEPPEDPFTGSATGCLAAYLWAEGKLTTPDFVAEQGHDLGRPGAARVRVLGAPNAITGVRVAGRGVTLMRGTLTL